MESHALPVTHTTVYIDESGFTGSHLQSEDQPVFTIASTTIGDDLSREILNEYVGPLTGKAREYKHSRLVKSDDGRQRIIRLIEAICRDHSQSLATYTIHKRFALLAKLIDVWIEPTLHREGYNLYKDGGALAFVNMMWACLPTFEGRDRFSQLLEQYERLARSPDLKNFNRFFSYVQYLYDTSANDDGQGLLSYILSASTLGPDHVRSLGQGSADIAYPSVFSTIAYWDAAITGSYSIVHDMSKNMEQFQSMLASVLDADTVERRQVAYDARLTYTLPFRAEDISFAESSDHTQLQICDLLAGATGAVARYALDTNYRPEYAQALIDAGVDRPRFGQIWPNVDDIKPHGLAPESTSDPLEEIAMLLKRREH